MTMTREAIQRAFFLILVVTASLFLLWIIRNYLFPVFWAVIFAILLTPLFSRTLRYVRFPSLAAGLTMLFSFLLVAVPVAWIGTLVAQEAYTLYVNVAQDSTLNALPSNPLILETLSSWGVDPAQVNTTVTEWARTASSWLIEQAFLISSATITTVFQFVLMLYLLFFFLRDGDRIVAYIKSVLPLSPKKEDALFSRFTATTRGTIKGSVTVAVMQGVVAGLIFWIAGVSSPLLWGVLVGILAFLPIVGPFMVWLPVSIMLISGGAYISAAFVAIGSLSMNIFIDDILRPILVGRETRIPNALVFIAIFGGLSTFGIAGLIIGPVVAALALTSWELFKEEYGADNGSSVRS